MGTAELSHWCFRVCSKFWAGRLGHGWGGGQKSLVLYGQLLTKSLEKECLRRVVACSKGTYFHTESNEKWRLHNSMSVNLGTDIFMAERRQNLVCPVAAGGNRTFFFMGPQHTLIVRESHVQSKPIPTTQTSKRTAFPGAFSSAQVMWLLPITALSMVLLLMSNPDPLPSQTHRQNDVKGTLLPTRVRFCLVRKEHYKSMVKLTRGEQ